MIENLKNIDRPCISWYVDHYNNVVPYEESDDIIHANKHWVSQNTLYPVIRQEICLAKGGKGKWPVRLLKWLIRKMPESWQPSTTISYYHDMGQYEIIKYLTEQGMFTFYDACVIASTLCTRCESICFKDLGIPLLFKYDEFHNMCGYCEILDPGYTGLRQTKACYLTMKNDGNIIDAFNKGCVQKSYILPGVYV